MKKYYILLPMLAILMASCTKDPLDSALTIPSVFESSGNVEADVFMLINDHRTSIGLGELQYDNTAYIYASSHTDYMISQGVISHDNFNARATSLSSEVNALSVAENVASNYPTALIAVQNWLASPSHRLSIEGDFTHTAVSAKVDDNGNLYYTQFFFKK